MCLRLQDVYHSKLPLHSSSSLFLHNETYSQNLRNMNCSIKTHVSVHLASLLEVEYRIHVSGTCNFGNDLMFTFFPITFTLQNIQKYAEIISGIVYYQNFFKLQIKKLHILLTFANFVIRQKPSSSSVHLSLFFIQVGKTYRSIFQVPLLSFFLFEGLSQRL